MPTAEQAKHIKTKTMKNPAPKMTFGMNFLPQRQMIGPKMKKMIERIHGFSDMKTTIAVNEAYEQPALWEN